MILRSIILLGKVAIMKPWTSVIENRINEQTKERN